jgi:hypothetical protein
VDELNHTVAKYRRQADEMRELLSSCPISAVVWSPGAGRWSILVIVLRRENVGLLEMIGDDVWRLKGRHDEYGELSLRELIEDYVTHTAKHLDQMRSAAAEFEDTINKP